MACGNIVEMIAVEYPRRIDVFAPSFVLLEFVVFREVPMLTSTLHSAASDGLLPLSSGFAHNIQNASRCPMQVCETMQHGSLSLFVSLKDENAPHCGTMLFMKQKVNGVLDSAGHCSHALSSYGRSSPFPFFDLLQLWKTVHDHSWRENDAGLRCH